jgi:hypothetical protein
MNERRYNLAGWIFFIVCALFFLAAGIRDKDNIIIAGSIFFLIACILFILPLAQNKNK